jgi:hypothetical protein
MTYADAIKLSGTGFAVYQTRTNKVYIQHSDGYRWQLVGKKLKSVKKFPGIGKDGWEPVMEDGDRRLLATLRDAYLAMTPPNISEPVVQSPGLAALLFRAETLFDGLKTTLAEAEDLAFGDPQYREKLDWLVEQATALKNLL